MAKQMTFTDTRQITLPDSYWRITNITIDVPNKRGVFVFSGYKDKATSDAAAGNPKITPVAQQVFTCRGADFDRYYRDHISGQKNLVQVGYGLANDQLVGGKKFFDGAADV